jgi:hypothetical protein
MNPGHVARIVILVMIYPKEMGKGEGMKKVIVHKPGPVRLSGSASAKHDG